MSFRTDIAEEAFLNWRSSSAPDSKLDGVSVSDACLYGVKISKIEITDAVSANILSKPVGKYYTLKLPDKFSKSSEQFKNIANALCSVFKDCFQAQPRSVLIAALGNPDITPDALGPIASEFLLVTRHLVLKSVYGFEAFTSVCISRPGVLGTTGFETAEQIKALCNSVRPDIVFVIDAFACSDIDRLCRTIQISDSGISPGSGVGNNREELNSVSLGVPVIAVGMPTVIDSQSFNVSGMRDAFVTPRSIDIIVRNAAKLIACGINLSLHSYLSFEEILSLTEQ